MIHIAGSYTMKATVERVWPHIFNLNELMNLIPGCQKLEQTSPDEYRGEMQVGIASVGGVYQTYVRVTRQQPPSHCAFEGEVSGASGIIKGEAAFQLREAEEETLLDYQAHAMITGALSQLNPRFLEGVVQTLIKLGLASLNRQLQAGQ